MVEAGWSRSRISRLGKALISASPPPEESLKELRELLIVYDAALDVAVARIREHLHVPATPRLKNTGTLLEKLRRSGGGSLGNVQDLAGIRIVLDCDLTEQIRFARSTEELFSEEARAPKLVDRRFEDLRGYRAIHVVVTVDGRPVEIQVRTRLQHQWANLFEKFADVVGRGIRYGEPPDEWTLLFDLEFESWARADVGSSAKARSLAAKLRHGHSALELIVNTFTVLSDGVRAYEEAVTSRHSREDVEPPLPPAELPNLDEVLRTARLLDVLAAGIVDRRQAYTPMVESAKRAAGEPDRERLRAELRKRVHGMDFVLPEVGER